MTEYTGWDDYTFEITRRNNHPHSCGFKAAVDVNVINEYFNPYGHGYKLQGDSWYVEFCPFCGVEID